MKKTLLFFGDRDCKQCNRILNKIKKYQLDQITKFDYIEAFNEKNQDVCDMHEVDEIPHIKLFNVDGELVFNEFGPINIISLLNAVS